MYKLLFLFLIPFLSFSQLTPEDVLTRWDNNNNLIPLFDTLIKYGLINTDANTGPFMPPNVYHVNEVTEKNGLMFNGENELITGKIYDIHDNGKLAWINVYINGKLSGICRGWYTNGNRDFITTWKNGQQNGHQTIWWENGNLALKANFLDGKREGDYVDWYEGGQLKTTVTFQNGEYDGLLCVYFEHSDQLKQKLNYTNGKLNGESMSYYPNGQVDIKGLFVKGQMHGAWSVYYENGQIEMFEIYRHNELLSKKCWDQNSLEINCD